MPEAKSAEDTASLDSTTREKQQKQFQKVYKAGSLVLMLRTQLLVAALATATASEVTIGKVWASHRKPQNR